MSYHKDPRVSDAVLVVVNDGDGTQCGLTYKDRLALYMPQAKPHALRLAEYRRAVRRWDTHRLRRYGLETGGPLSGPQVQAAAVCLESYYSQHVKEFDKC